MSQPNPSLLQHPITTPPADQINGPGQHTLPPSPSTNTVQLRVGGMTCASCVNSIESVVKSLVGVSDAVVSLLLDSATVHYDDRLSADRIRDAIEEIGYEAEVVNVRTSDHIPSTAASVSEVASVPLHISGMTCASCVQSLETHLRSQPFVTSVVVNLLTESAIVHFTNTGLYGDEGDVIAKIVAAVEEIGYQARISARNKKVSELAQILRGLVDCKECCKNMAALATTVLGTK